MANPAGFLILTDLATGGAGLGGATNDSFVGGNGGRGACANRGALDATAHALQSVSEGANSALKLTNARIFPKVTRGEVNRE